VYEIIAAQTRLANNAKKTSLKVINDPDLRFATLDDIMSAKDRGF
tara:strand:- start:715 stop:849 length:135 start_codon:yes stop_codon:yes gene_type:complete